MPGTFVRVGDASLHKRQTIPSLWLLEVNCWDIEKEPAFLAGSFVMLRGMPGLHFQTPERFGWLRTQKSVLHHREEGLRIKTLFCEGSGRNRPISGNWQLYSSGQLSLTPIFLPCLIANLSRNPVGSAFKNILRIFCHLVQVTSTSSLAYYSSLLPGCLVFLLPSTIKSTQPEGPSNICQIIPLL